jgi:hypothetical protein
MSAAASGEDPFAGFATVQPVFERLLDEAAAAQPSAPLACLPNWTPGERAVLATRVIGSEVDNSGSPGIFFNGEDGLLPDAIEGYRLLGLDDHANALADLVASGFSGESPEEAGETFDETWFSLPDAEPARAAYIAGHPTEFRT